MSTQIDERVVEMRFENDKFESGVKESLNSIEKLKKSLDFKGSGDSVKSLENAFNHFSLDGIGNAIENISEKFNAFGIIGITALQNITNKAIDAGIALAKSLSVDQLSAGWQKYADKTSSVQTILAATGESMEYVDAQLAKLNWYTDETSYNFVDMVSNIGKFTSVGVPLQEATTAMMGIANWAAISGAGIQGASRAMYNLSQAMGVGAVKLMDWKSIENANMATAEFKQTVLDTAVEMGALTDAGDGLYATLDGKTTLSVQDFTDSLKKEWFTADVLVETLKKYGGIADDMYEVYATTGATATEQLEEMGDATSDLGVKSFRAAQEAKTFADAVGSVKDAVSTGWMNIFEMIFGNYDKARKTWTNLANDLWDVFASGVTDRVDRWKEARYAVEDWDWDTLISKVNEAGVSTARFKKALADIGKEDNLPIKALVKQYGSLEASAKSGWMTTERVARAIRSLAGTGSQSTVETLGDINELLYDIWHNGRPNGWKQEVIDLGYDPEKFEKLLIHYNQVFGERGFAVKTLTDDEILKVYGELPKVLHSSTGEIRDNADALEALAKEAEATGVEYGTLVKQYYRKGAFDSFVEGSGNIIKTIASVVYSIRDAFQNMFPPATRDTLLTVADNFRSVTASVLEFVNATDENEKTPIYYAITALLTPLKLVVVSVKALLKIMSPVTGLIGSIVKGTVSLLSHLGKIGERLNEETDGFSNISTVIKTFVDIIGAGISLVVNFSKSVYELVKPSILGKFNEWLSKIKEKTDGLFNLEKITEYLEKIKSIDADKYASKFVNFLKAVKNSETPLKTAVELIENKLTAHFPKLGEAISLVVEKLNGFWESIKNFKMTRSDGSIITIAESFEILKNKAVAAFEQIQDKFDGATTIGEKFSTVLEWIREKLGAIRDFISGKFSKSISETEEVSENKEGLFSKIFGDEFDWKKLLKGGAFVALGAQLFGLFKILKGISKIGNITKEGIGKKIGEFISGIVDSIRGKADDAKRFDWAGFSLGIGLLAAAMIGLAAVGDWKKIGVAAAAMVVAVTAVVVAFSKISKLTKIDKKLGKNVAEMGLGLVGAASALLIFVGVINKFSKMSLSIKEIGKVFAGILSAVVTFKAISKAGKGITFSNGMGMITSISSLLIFANVLKKFAKLSFNGNEILNIIKSLGLCIAAFVPIMLTFKLSKIGKAEFGGKFGLGGGLALIGVATAMLEMAKVLEKFSTISYGGLKNAVKVIGSLGAAVVALGSLAFILKLRTPILGKLKITSAIALIGIAESLYLVAKAIEKFNGIQINDAGAVLSMMVGAVTALSILVSLMSNMSVKAGLGSLISIISITGFLLVFIESAALLSKMLDPKMAASFGILSVVMIALGVAVKLARGITVKASIGTFVTLTGIVGAIYGMVYAMKLVADFNIRWNHFLIVLASIGTALGAVAAICLIAKAMTLGGGILYLGALGVVGLIIAAVAGIGVAFIPLVRRMQELQGLDFEAVKYGIECLDQLLGELTVFQFRDIPSIIASLIAFDGLGPSLGSITSALADLKGLDNEGATAGMNAVRDLIDIMKSLAQDISDGVVIVENAISAGTILKSFGDGLKPVVESAAIIATLNPAAHTEGLKAVNELINLLKTTADRIKSGDIDYEASITAAGALKAFGDGLKPVAESAVALSSVDATTAIAAIPVIDGLIDIITGLAQKISDNTNLYEAGITAASLLNTFGTSLSPIVDAITALSATDGEAAAATLAPFSELIDKLMGIAQKMTENPTLYTVANAVTKMCKSFAKTLVTFDFAAMIASKVDAESAKDGLAVIQSMIDMLYNTAKKFSDNPDVYSVASGIAESCKTFATAMLGFASSEMILGLANAETAQAGFNVVGQMIDKLVELATKFSNDEELFTGATSASEACLGFAKAMKKFASTENRLSKVEAEAVIAALVPVQTMVDMMIKLATSFATEDKISKANSATTAFETFGTTVTNMVDSLSYISDENLASVAPILDSIGRAFESLLGIEGLGSEDFSKSMNDLANVPWESIKTGLSTLAGGIKELNKNNVNFSETVEELKDFSSAINELNSAGETIVNSISTILSSFDILGRDIVNTLCDSIERTSEYRTRAAASNLIVDFRSNINSYMGLIENAGYNISAGLAAGIYDGSYRVAAAARSVAMQAANAARNALAIRSPSRVFAGIGEYASIGLARGIESGESEIISATTNMVNSAVTMARSIADSLADDLNPVITPVLDLSAVERDSWRLGGMLPSGSIRLSSQVSASNAKIQNERFAEKAESTPIVVETNNGSSGLPPKIDINFEGSLSQLAAVLQPAITVETNRLGKSLVKG